MSSPIGVSPGGIVVRVEEIAIILILEAIVILMLEVFVITVVVLVVEEISVVLILIVKSDIGDILRTPTLIVPASPTITLGPVPPHGGTACKKNAPSITTPSSLVVTPASPSRATVGHLTVPLGIGVHPGDPLKVTSNGAVPDVSSGITFESSPATP